MRWLRGTRTPQSTSTLIDVRDLIAELTDADLLQAADAYFSSLTVEAEQCYKPFSNVGDAVHIHRNLGQLLQAASLFKGADVLDFGCATGWLTLSLASLGCQTVGVDVAPSAIALAEEWMRRRGVRAGGAATFSVYDGRRLPLDEASIDRVICFDAFHHVRDQAATLREFARVLRPGGRIAMLEPGPHHSRTAQSQMEMSLYRVIENDVDIRLVAEAAHAAGLGAPTMLVQLPQPLEISASDYLQWSLAGEMPRADAQRLVGTVAKHLTNTQCFYIAKPGQSIVDSRQGEALAAELTLISTQLSAEGHPTYRVKVRNTGEAAWRVESGAGQVNLGVQLLDAAGKLIARDYQRVSVGSSLVLPGQIRQVEFTLAPGIMDVAMVHLDMVSEHVTWFSDVGRSRPLELPVNEDL